MPIGFKRELDQPPLKLAALFLVVLAVVNILSLAYQVTSNNPGYYYFQAALGVFLAIFVFFAFRLAWGLTFTLYGFYIFRDITALFALWKQSDELQSLNVGIICFVLVGLILECLIVGALFISSYRMIRRQTDRD